MECCSSLRPVGGLVDFVRDRENGLLFNPFEKGALAAAFNRLTPPLVVQLVAGDYATACVYAWPRMIDDFAHIYAALVSRRLIPFRWEYDIIPLNSWCIKMAVSYKEKKHWKLPIDKDITRLIYERGDRHFLVCLCLYGARRR